MARAKKNAIANVLFPMVDKTDGISIESGLSAADIKPRYYGKVHGASTAASTASLAVPSLVHSGLFNLKIPAATTSKFDIMLLRMSSTSTVSCAIQLIPLELVDNDDSDIMSRLTGMSDTLSKVWKATSNVSDTDSKLLSRIPKGVATSSGLTVVYNSLLSEVDGLSNMLSGMSNILSAVYVDTADISDVLSKVRVATTGTSDFESKILSRVPKGVATASGLTVVFNSLLPEVNGISLTLAGMSNVLSNVHGDLADLSGIVSDFYSDFTSKVPTAPASTSKIDVLLTRVPNTVATSDMLSDTLSKLSDTLSKMGAPEHIASLVWDGGKGSYADAGSMGSVLQAVGTTGLTASDISDIVSAVWGAKYDVHSNASSFGSAFEVLLSGTSDLTSRITSVVNSTSDFVSQIWAHSAATVMKSRLSNVNSGMDKLTSRVPKMAATDSGMTVVYNSLLSEINGISDILSNVRAYVVNASDITSKIWKATSNISDTDSKLLSRIPKGVATSSGMTVVYNSLLSEINGASDILSKVYGHTTGASDVLSKVYAHTTGLSDTASKMWKAVSNVSDTDSKLLSRIPKAVATESELSDTRSKILSAVGGISVTLTASDISDIASAAAAAVGAGVASQVWARSDASLLTAAMNSTLSQATQANSRALVIQSMVSDVTIGASTLSDIASAVWAQKWDVHSAASSFGSAFEVLATNTAAAASRALLNQSLASGLYTKVASEFAALSNMVSNVDADVANMSNVVSNIHADLADMSNVVSNIHADLADLSDITSKVRMEVLGVDSLLSNVHTDVATVQSMASDIQSDAAVAESRISDIYSLLQADAKGGEKFVTATGKYTKYATDGVTQLWSHVVASDATSVVRGAGA